MWQDHFKREYCAVWGECEPIAQRWWHRRKISAYQIIHWCKTHQIWMQHFSVKQKRKKISMSHSNCNFYTPQRLCTPKARVVGAA